MTTYSLLVQLALAVLFVLFAYAAAPTPGQARYVPQIVTWFWRTVARAVARPRVADWLIRRAMKTPFTHLPGYMNRYWLFNAYDSKDGKPATPISWLPSIRVHHILRPDEDRHLHDHPWDARTIILKGGYVEEKLCAYGVAADGQFYERTAPSIRLPGDTTPIRFGEFHSIMTVPEAGAWTMFITFRYRGVWGFLVDGRKVPWREYKAQHPEKPWASEEPTT